MIDLSGLELWFVTGSQHLYGPETLEKVADHARTIAEAMDEAKQLPVRVVCKPVMTTQDAIHELCLDANRSRNCIGLITWMHTFSPAKMWISGLKALDKPFVHLHAQFNRELPWSTIDMDFMNLNQSAHGDREFGFIGSRMRLNRKVIVGYWREESLLSDLAIWCRAACAWHDAQHLKVARFGDNMRNVAVTEGDKVEAQIKLRYSVNGYGVGDLVSRIRQVADADVDKLVSDYDNDYEVAGPLRSGGACRPALREAARIELGLRYFLQDGGLTARGACSRFSTKRAT